MAFGVSSLKADTAKFYPARFRTGCACETLRLAFQIPVGGISMVGHSGHCNNL